MYVFIYICKQLFSGSAVFWNRWCLPQIGPKMLSQCFEKKYIAFFICYLAAPWPTMGYCYCHRVSDASLDLRVTGSLLTRLGPKGCFSTYWGFELGALWLSMWHLNPLSHFPHFPHFTLGWTKTSYYYFQNPFQEFF